MASESKEGVSIPYSGIVGLVLVGLTIVAQHAQLDSARLTAHEQRHPQEHTWLQSIESRMWQDPMSVVARYREMERADALQKEQLARQIGAPSVERKRDLLPPDDRNEITRIMTTPAGVSVCRAQEKVRVLAAMVLGGQAEEDSEMRRRTRYAVVSGLMNAGYQPDNGDAIGYAYVPRYRRNTDESRLPETIPFEWFKRAVGNEQSSTGRREVDVTADGLGDRPALTRDADADEGIPKNQWEWILVLWLDQSQYYAKPLGRLRSVVGMITPSARDCAGNQLATQFSATVLGPVDSESLKELINDIKRDQGVPADTPPVLPRMLPASVRTAFAAQHSTQPDAAQSSRAVLRSTASSNSAAQSVEPADATHRKRLTIDIVSASATAPIDSDPDAPPRYYMDGGSVAFMRVIGSDARLSQALIDELVMRNLHVRQPVGGRTPAVIVVNEQDTDYGRDFINQIRRSIDNQAVEDAFAVRSFSYLRRIDGGVPTSAAASRNASSERDADKGKGKTDRYARSHGSHQVDYLRRLVDEIYSYRDDEHADPQYPGKKDIVAIAVLGNDVYDKLLVLRALKPAFPKAVFLTTDLDTRLLDQEEAKWTRNLIVATNYGFTLNPALQRGVAPFRDGYQTATYLAALLIAGDCIGDTVRQKDGSPAWLAQPLVFEIGRNGAIPLTEPSEHPTDFSRCAFPEKLQTVAVQPALMRPTPPAPRTILMFTGVVLLLGTVILSMVLFAGSPPAVSRVAAAAGSVSTQARKSAIRIASFVVSVAVGVWLGSLFDAITNTRGATFAGLLYGIACCIGLSFLQDRSPLEKHRFYRFLFQGEFRLYTGPLLFAPGLYLIVATAWPAFHANVEPFSWLDGVSVWPTQLLRAVAGILAVVGLWRIGWKSKRDAHAITDQFGLAGGADDGPQPDGMAKLWDGYVTHRRQRIITTNLFTVAYFVFCMLVMYMLEDTPGVPVRGADNLYAIQKLLGFTFYMSVTLLMGVALAYAGFVLGFLRPVVKSELDVAFPDKTHAWAHNLKGVATGGCRHFLNLVMAVELAARRSQTLTGFIYYPFAVFALLLVARSPLFDNWDTPIGLGIILLLPFVIVIGCVAWLRFETVLYHKKILGDMRTEIIRLRGLPETTDAQMWQMEQLYERVQNEHRGSFQNLALQPLIRALLLPIGGFSGIQILEQLLGMQ